MKITLRHPKECNFYLSHNRFKFGEWCDFDHIEKKNDVENCKASEKTSGLEKSLKEKDEKLTAIQQQVDEKDLKIENLSKKVEDIEANVKYLLENLQNKDRKAKSTKSELKCLNCDFKTSSDHG